MKHYLAEVIWNNPFPKKYQFRVAGSNIALAAKRSLAELRKDNKGRRIKEVTLHLTQV